MRISDWSSDVCSSDLARADPDHGNRDQRDRAVLLARPAPDARRDPHRKADDALIRMQAEARSAPFMRRPTPDDLVALARADVLAVRRGVAELRNPGIGRATCRERGGPDE